MEGPFEILRGAPDLERGTGHSEERTTATFGGPHCIA